jgi:hypothetical protein
VVGDFLAHTRSDGGVRHAGFPFLYYRFFFETHLLVVVCSSYIVKES